MIYSVVHIIDKYKEALVGGLLTTLALCFIVWIVGLLLGCVFGIFARRNKEEVGKSLDALSFLLSSIPFLVLLFWLYYPLQELLHIAISPFITAAFALSMLNTILVAQIVRTALDEFPNEFVIAGKVCGLSERRILTQIEFPIILRQVLPQILSAEVQILQMTVFASLISAQELFRVAQQINAIIYKPIEIYTTLALFFIAICLPLNLLTYRLKEKYTRNLSET